MNTVPKLFGWIFLLLAGFFAFTASAQTPRGNKNVVSEQRSVPPFEEIQAGGAFRIFLTIKDQYSITVETDENLLGAIKTTVEGKRLKISTSGVRNPTALNIYVTAPVIKRIDLSGASTLSSSNTLATEELKIKTSGAAELEMEIDVDYLELESDGASEIVLKGSAEKAVIEASGAVEIRAGELTIKNAEVTSSGASEIRIHVTDKISKNITGASTVIVTGEAKPESQESPSRSSVRAEKSDGKPYTRVKVGGLVVEVKDKDSTVVSIGDKSIVVDESGTTINFGSGEEKSRDREKKTKFNGHWAGLDLGINGYLNSSGKFSIPQDYQFLELNYEKSIDVGLNLFDQSIPLWDHQLGIVTGLGIRWNNYRFYNPNTILVNDSSTIYGYFDDDTRWKKSKLVNNYLTLPVFLEYQTRGNANQRFFMSAGVVTGWRFRTWTKMKEDSDNRRITKSREPFHMNPFKFDLMYRIGYGRLSLYGSYALNTLFPENKGPELYPFAVGISFSGW